MIKFAKERVNLICSQLKGWSVVQKVSLEHMQVKEGCFIIPEEADAAPGEWKILIWEEITGMAWTVITGSGQRGDGS